MPQPALSDEQLLSLVEDLLRSMPDRSAMRYEDESLAWLGRLLAVADVLDPSEATRARTYTASLRKNVSTVADEAYNGIVTLLHTLKHKQLMRLPGPASLVVPHAATFEYFDGLRKIIEQGRREVFFVDPYLNPDFVAKYLPHVSPGVAVRLLGRHKFPALVASAKAFAEQHGHSIATRCSQALHDRYIFIDGAACYQSGASFKDGAKNAPTAITEVKDAAAAMLQTFESLWRTATVSE